MMWNKLRSILCAHAFSKTFRSMEVTKENFSDAFLMLQSVINKAEFVAIDGEFTGLSTLKRSRFTYDTVQEHYLKLKEGSSKFLLIQYGISVFTWNDEFCRYEATPFTFYIYPRPYKKFYNDIMFMSQSSSLDFLVNNGFDFNKLFHKGISFMPTWEKEKAEKRLDREHKRKSSTGNGEEVIQHPLKPIESTVFIPKDERSFINGVTEKVKLFLQSSESQLDLPACNAFQRKLIYETLQQMYPMGLYLESVTKEGGETKYIRAIKVTSKDMMEERKLQKYQQELDELEEIVGFTKVITLLGEAKKPIIGHNMLLDLFYTVTNFISPPPDDLKGFKSILTQYFPTVIDTKLISTTQPLAGKLSGTSLKSLMESVEKDVLPQPNVFYSDEVVKFIDAENQYHQAGYDAYCTGCSFISLSKSLLLGLNLPSDRIDISCDILSPFVNRVNIFNIKDIKYIDISRPDKIPDRKNVFLVKFPKEWKENDIINLFSGVCQINRPLTWLNDTSVYVTLHSENSYDDVMEKLVLNINETNSFSVVPYTPPLCSLVVDNEENCEDQPRKGSLDDNNDGLHQTRGDFLGKRKRMDQEEIEDGEICDNESSNVTPVVKKTFEEPNEW